ncbi:hypothetical protein B2A_15687, partial [mine drainage metagenome]
SGESLRIICNLASGGTNPAAIDRLRELKHVELRQMDDLHAKVIVTDHAVIVGSANVSANGLGYEDSEVKGWHEAGILSDSAEHTKVAQEWFDRLWDKSRVILDEDMKAAEKRWKSRRNLRPSRNQNVSLLQQSLASLKDRDIHLAIYRDEASTEALEAFETSAKKVAKRDEVKEPCAKLDFFESWPKNSPLPTDPQASIIEVHFNSQEDVVVEGIWRPLNVRQEFKYGDRTTGYLDFLAKREAVGDWTLSKQDLTKLASDLKPWLDFLHLNNDEDRCIPFYEFKRWQEQGPHAAKE